MYHRYAASKRTFTYVDYRIFQMLWRWCRRRHPKKSRKWIKEKYFSKTVTATGLHRYAAKPERPRRPIQLMAAATVRIIRYVKIQSDVNPYDPEWEPYLEERMGWQLAQTLAGRAGSNTYGRNKGRCLVCGRPLRIAEADRQIHHRIWRTRGGQDTADNLELLHANCHRQIHVQERRTKATASREGVSECLSWMKGNFHVQFLGEGWRKRHLLTRLKPTVRLAVIARTSRSVPTAVKNGAPLPIPGSVSWRHCGPSCPT